MIIESTDDETIVWVRQSWLNDAMLCPERARLGVLKPEWRSGSDATVLGTAVHTAIEQVLRGACVIDSIDAAFVDGLEQAMVKEPNFKFQSMTSVADMENFGLVMCQSFARDIYPSVQLGGEVEKTFATHLVTVETPMHPKPVRIMLSGTMDYLQPDGTVWDWKTAARKYSQSEKQKQSIQASVYCYAVVNNGWASGYPVRFNYGVMTRVTNSVGQIVPVVRTESHARWLQSQVTSVVLSGLAVGLENQWFANDQNNLCSSKWCNFWSICKGSSVSESDNTMPEEGN